MLDQNFENITNMFDGMLDKIEHSANMLEGQLDIIENSGKFAGDAYFKELIKTQEESTKKLQEKYVELQNARNEAVWSGKISEDSEAYSEMTNEINDVAEAWQEAKNQMLEYKNEMWEMQDAAFEWAQERISDITSESEFIRELLAVNENDLFNKDTGRFNEKGWTTGALHALDYNVNMAQADAYAKKIQEINAELAKDPNNTILLERKQEYIEAQRESIQAANDEKVAVKDLVENQYDRMLDILQELIDKRKEQLEVEKSLYDYEQEIAEKTSNIASIKKQLLSIQGDDSEESKAKKQSLSEQLKEAEKDLERSEYEQFISDQEKLMDSLYDEAERLLNERLDNIDGLLQSMIDYGNTNTEVVNSTITEATSKVGYTMTEGMTSIWNSTETGVGKVLTMYSANFSATLTTTNNYIKGIFDILKENTKSKVEVEKPKDTTTTKPKPQPQPSKPKPQPQPAKPKAVHVGSVVSVSPNTPIFNDSYGGVGPYGTHQYYAGDPKYVVIGENNGYWLVRHHTQSSGAGWFRKGDVAALATGGYTGNQEGLALLHKKERVLSAQQTKAFENLVYGLLPVMSDGLKNGYSGVQNSRSNSVTIGDVHFELPNVTDYESFMKELKGNKKFNRVIEGIVLDSMNGSSMINKNKIRF